MTISALLFLGQLPLAQAQEIVEVTKQSRLKVEEASSAKQQLMTEAIELASYENIKNIIGEEKTERSKEIIKNKIIRQSDKYVLAVKGMNFIKKENEYLMDVSMKISLRGLRALLLEQGLLYQIDGPPKVLPFVEITDRIGGQSYGWWFQTTNKENRALADQLGTFHVALRDEMQRIGFYAMSPISTRLYQTVPEAYRLENLQNADFLFLGEYFKSSIILKGELLYKIKPKAENIYSIDVHVQALHSSNGRLMAEVARVYDTEAGAARIVIPKRLQEVSSKIAEDLSAQLSDTWKRGTFGASIVKLAVVGKINPRELEEFKKMIVLQVRDIKSLRERLIEANKTTYEVDSSALPQKLAQSLADSKFLKFKVEVKDVSAEAITIKVESI